MLLNIIYTVFVVVVVGFVLAFGGKRALETFYNFFYFLFAFVCAGCVVLILHIVSTFICSVHSPKHGITFCCSISFSLSLYC